MECSLFIKSDLKVEQGFYSEPRFEGQGWLNINHGPEQISIHNTTSEHLEKLSVALAFCAEKARKHEAKLKIETEELVTVQPATF